MSPLQNNFEITQNQPTEAPAPAPIAVLVRNASKSYGDRTIVLNDMNMSVPMGSIYGLLGSSGCGKTSILSCIVGLRKLDKGTIKVFGAEPGSAESKPGYMPQEIALYQIFRMDEVFQYYGRITNMTNTSVKARMQFLTEFLQLPDPKILVKNLSGGQQRRLSLAVSMLHSPKLLILDEPTVGVDPILRASIWSHLEQLVEKNKITILITTHYIEEAKQSNTVGIMRNGRLLVESNPLELLEQYNEQFLETVFLRLCAKDENDARAINPSANYSTTTSFNGKDDSKIVTNYEECQNVTIMSGSSGVRKNANEIRGESTARNCHDFTGVKDDDSFCNSFTSHLNKIKSVAIKNFLSLIRIPLFGLLLVVIPPVQVVMFQTLLGNDPKNIPLGIVNNELPANTHLMDYCGRVERGCFTEGTSCRFINSFSSVDVNWLPYKSEEEALESVEKGKTLGYFLIPANYTQHMFDRSVLKMNMENDTIEGSTIRSRLDASFNLKSSFVQSKAFSALQKMVKELAESCGSDSRIVEVPLIFDAVYGSLDQTFQSFMQPGQIVLILIILPMVCSFDIVGERKSFTLQRAIVSGLKHQHIVIGFMLSEGLLVGIQVALCGGVMGLGYGVVIKGRVWQAMLILSLIAIVGLSYGLFVGECADNEIEASFMILGLYIPLMVSSGGTWDDVSMPPWLRSIFRLTPTSMATRSLRNIFLRGWDISHQKVFPGFLGVIAWIAVFLVLSTIVKRVRKC